MLSSQNAVDLAVDTEKAHRSEWARINRFVRYARGKQRLPWLPDNVESEYKDIARKSASNWLALVVQMLVQGLRIDGYGDRSEDSAAWVDGWQANGMDSRQSAHNQAIFTCGYGYGISFPSEDGGVWMRPEAAVNIAAVFDDPGDDWPRHVLRTVSKTRWELYDDEARYTLTHDGRRWQVTATAPHNAGVTPVVYMPATFDLLGAPMGEIEPVMPVQDRIVDATFTLQMVAKYGAFPQRWIAGLNPAEPMRDASGEVLTDAHGNPVMPNIKAYVDHILTAADVDTKFGQFAAADLRQYVEALEAHIRHLAAMTETPAHYLLGSTENPPSAEALAAAEAGFQRKIGEKQEVLSDGYEQWLRLDAKILGDEDAADDISSRVHWQDVDARSLAQAADAMLKLRDVGVPVAKMLPMIPGWTKDDVDETLEMIAEGDPMTAFLERLNGDAGAA